MNLKELVLKAKELQGIEVKDEVVEEAKANEVMHTTNTGFWKEVIPVNVLLDPALDMLPKYSSLINLLPWNHGNNMPISAKVPVIGEADLFAGNSEWTTGVASITPANNWPVTGEVTITQGQFIFTVALSYREVEYSVVDIEAIVKDRINRSAWRTIDALIINADDTASASGNINGTYTGNPYFVQQSAGIRKVWITNTVVTFTSASLLAVKGEIDAGYQADLNNLLFIAPSNVYNKMLALQEVITMDKFWPNATIVAGVLAKAFGIDILVARDFPALTNTSGLVDATSSNNTKGSFACIYKPAVQYGFGSPLKLYLSEKPGHGYEIVATMDFGFAIANSVAGLGKTVALGINMTV